jgi:hypothetical protein
MPIVGVKSNAGAFGLGWSAVAPEDLGGMVLMKPTSIAYTGTSATIGTNGSVEFSACSSLSLNGVFSADYDNYVIATRIDHSTLGVWRFRMRSSGTDEDSVSNYYTTQFLYATNTSVTGGRNTGNLSSFGWVGPTVKAGYTANFYGPFLAQPTAIRTFGASNESSGTIVDYAWTHSLSTSYDGITMFSDAAYTANGLVSVYGLVGT